MKILIIATPRTGSSELASRLARYLQLTVRYEPFNVVRSMHPLEPHDVQDKVVIKCIIDQVPPPYDKNDPIAFYLEYMKKFDKVILLRRSNVVKQIESWNWFSSHAPTRTHNRPYVYSRQPDYEAHEKYILRLNSELDDLSKITKIPITYYEKCFQPDQDKFRQDDKRSAL